MSITRELGKVSVVPKGEWNKASAYEALDIAAHAGRSYIAKRSVPVGTDISDTSYWMQLTGRINGGAGADPVAVAKIKDYLYEAWYDRLDYNGALKYFKSHESDLAAACSSVRKGNYYGRNLDLAYDNRAEFIVHVPRIGDSFASVSICGGFDDLTDDFVSSGGDSDSFVFLPFQCYDGINEHGLIANINVVPADKGYNKAIPTGTSEIELTSAMVIRYILDHFDNATDAVNFISQHMTIYFSRETHDRHFETHFMIADIEKTYVVEFADDAAVVSEMTLPYMTNFHITGDFVTNSDGTVYTPATQDASHDAVATNHITEHGCGLERYNIIASAYSALSGESGMRNLLNQLTYTRAYPGSASYAYWYTEFTGDNLKCNSDTEDFSDILDQAAEAYANRDRDDPETWHTVHSVVYDIANLTAKVIVQEDGQEISFALEKPYEDIFIKGVKLDNSLLTKDSDGTVNIPVADASHSGIIKVNTGYAYNTFNGALVAPPRSLSDYLSLGEYSFIGKGTLENLLNGGYIQRTAASATVSIPVSAWSNNTATVSVTGVTANNIVQLTTTDKTSADEWGRRGVFCASQGSGTLIFTCVSTPTSAINIGVIVW